jgi:hypothetical protein
MCVCMYIEKLTAQPVNNLFYMEPRCSLPCSLVPILSDEFSDKLTSYLFQINFNINIQPVPNCPKISLRFRRFSLKATIWITSFKIKHIIYKIRYIGVSFPLYNLYARKVRNLTMKLTNRFWPWSSEMGLCCLVQYFLTNLLPPSSEYKRYPTTRLCGVITHSLSFQAWRP